MNTFFRCIATGTLILFTSSGAFAQQSATKPASHKYRAIMTAAGAGGGFTAGVFTGIALFDDAINSDRKVWTCAIVGSAAGGVGGYFIGRAIDRHKERAGLTPRNLDLYPVVSKEVKGVRFAFRF